MSKPADRESTDRLLTGEFMISAIITHESIALDMCIQLVRKGVIFGCERVPGGWRFDLYE